MASTESSKLSRLSAGSGDRSPSPYTNSDQPKQPHTSISSIPEVPVPMESTARRRRRSETQELRNKVELLGTKVSPSCRIAILILISQFSRMICC